MDWYLTILRVLHIFSGLYWVGAGLFLALFLYPAAERMGANGHKMFGELHKSRIYVASMPVAAVLTTVVGFLLYAKVSGNFDAEWMKTTRNWVLSIGIVAGFLAFGHGAGALGPMDGKYGKLLKEVDNQPDGATPEQQAQLDAMVKKLGLHGKISAGLAVIAVIFMAGHRYVV